MLVFKKAGTITGGALQFRAEDKGECKGEQAIAILTRTEKALFIGTISATYYARHLIFTHVTAYMRGKNPSV